MVSRLETIAPDIAAEISAATEASRQKAAFAVARLAVEKTGLENEAVNKALAGKRARELKDLVAVLDGEYFSLQGRVDAGEQLEAAVLSVFSQARAASAVDYAVSQNPNEAIYEAIVATDDLKNIQRLVSKTLGKRA